MQAAQRKTQGRTPTLRLITGDSKLDALIARLIGDSAATGGCDVKKGGDEKKDKKKNKKKKGSKKAGGKEAPKAAAVVGQLASDWNAVALALAMCQQLPCEAAAMRRVSLKPTPAAVAAVAGGGSSVPLGAPGWEAIVKALRLAPSRWALC